MADCQHPEESREFDPGNHVPGFGWEIYPEWYCRDCGTSLDINDPPPYSVADDPDLARKYEKENPQ